MASFKYLIFFTLAALSVYSVAAENAAPQEPTAESSLVREKKHAYIAAAPAPVVAYSAPAAYPYAYSALPAAYPAAYPYAAYPAAYPAYSTYSAYPSYAYAHDDGKYWPGKYEKTYYPAYKTAYPYAYHY